MVHRRIQKKKRNKLKSVDPFNKNSDAIREAKLKGKNLEPIGDDQPLTFRQLQIEQSLCSTNEKPVKHRISEVKLDSSKKRNKDGYDCLANRKKLVTHCEEPKMGKLKTSNKSISKKLMKREIQKQAKNNSNSFSRVVMSTSVTKETVFNNSGNEQSSIKKKRKNCEKSKDDKQNDSKEFLLNAREYIPFGTRYDAPPEFSVTVRQKMKLGSTKNNWKSLCIHDVLESQEKNKNGSDNGENTCNLMKKKAKLEELEMERIKVIELCRKQKSFKRGDKQSF